MAMQKPKQNQLYLDKYSLNKHVIIQEAAGSASDIVKIEKWGGW